MGRGQDSLKVDASANLDIIFIYFLSKERGHIEIPRALKRKIQSKQAAGNSLNINRAKIKNLTNKIEQIRKKNALRGMVDESGEIIKTDEEDKIQLEISKLKQTY